MSMRTRTDERREREREMEGVAWMDTSFYRTPPRLASQERQRCWRITSIKETPPFPSAGSCLIDTDIDIDIDR